MYLIYIFILFMISSLMADAHRKNQLCPNYILKCPDCKINETCVYPGYRNCPFAGIPSCKPICSIIKHAIVAKGCPDECPYSCKYENPGCYLGKPVCQSPCYTFAPCKVNPCPKKCKDYCIYPDADYCCPYSGTPICPPK
ncbi:unnamed protein product [Cunninghamella blakesleeana]